MSSSEYMLIVYGFDKHKSHGKFDPQLVLDVFDSFDCVETN